MKGLLEKNQGRLLLISPHPDDESVFFGGTLKKYSEMGVDIHVLLLTNGELGSMSIRKGNKFQVHSNESVNNEELADIRIRELKNAISILGIPDKNITYAGCPNLGVDSAVTSVIETEIRKVNPHVVLSFNEAGTTRCTNPDHAWSGAATYKALQNILRSNDLAQDTALTGYYTYVLPEITRYFDIFCDIDSSLVPLQTIDIRQYKQIKKEAVFMHESQHHVMSYFERVGLLNIDTESYIQRIKRTNTVDVPGELFVKDPNNLGTDFVFNGMPLSPNNYVTSDDSLFTLLEEKQKFIQS